MTRIRLGRAAGTGVRGLVATAAATVGDLLLRVPLEACLTETRALPASLGRAPASMTWDVRLALRLHDAAHGGDPFWERYAALLPAATAMAAPLLLDDARLEALKDPIAAAAARAQRRRLLDLFPAGDLPEAALPRGEGGDPSLWPGSLPRAWALVRSRAFSAGRVVVDFADAAGEETDLFAFVPFLDMANEDRVAPTAGYEIRDGAFELRARANLAPGDVVTVAYASDFPSPRAHFALYGFVPEGDLAAALGAGGGPDCAGLSAVDCRVAEYAALAASGSRLEL